MERNSERIHCSEDDRLKPEAVDTESIEDNVAYIAHNNNSPLGCPSLLEQVC